MADHDHMREAEPNWVSQAEDQLSDLYMSLEEIGDPTALEAWGVLEARLNELSSSAALEAINAVEEDRAYHTPDSSGYPRADEDWFCDVDGKG